jgi:hypothetical protein
VDVEQPFEHRFLGTVEVDSGTLLIGDPGYCLPRAEDGTPGIDYAAVIAARPNEVAQYLRGQLVLLISHFGGDGTYPVFGDVDEDGELVSVTIEFVGPDEGEGE